jgi:pimeloyl-ACP methyl ester carboxylesterase
MSLCNVIATAAKPEYGNVKVPLLILVGSEDKTAPLSGSEAILKAYGASKDEKKIEILDNVGHWHCIEAPEVVGDYVLKFIQKFS